jgi:hypothetical protein
LVSPSVDEDTAIGGLAPNLTFGPVASLDLGANGFLAIAGEAMELHYGDVVSRHGTAGYGAVFHDDYGVLGSGATTANLATGSPFSVGNVCTGAQNKIAALWVPATSNTEGRLSFFYDGVQVGNSSYWNQYTITHAPPPTAGTTGSIMDVRHWVLMLGTSNAKLPMTVSSLKVWQASAGGNYVQ